MREFEVGGRKISLALYTDVTNSKELLEAMQDGKLEPEAAFLNVVLIPDVFPVLASAHSTLSRVKRATENTHSSFRARLQLFWV